MLNELNHVIDYIEEHLTDNHLLKKLSMLGFLTITLKDIFILPLPLSEYIKTESYRKQIGFTKWGKSNGCSFEIWLSVNGRLTRAFKNGVDSCLQM